MTVYLIIIEDEEGRTHAHDLFWHKEKAEKCVTNLLKHDSDWSNCNIKVVPKELRE